LGISPGGYIDIDDAQAVLRIIRRTPAQKPIGVIIYKLMEVYAQDGPGRPSVNSGPVNTNDPQAA